MRDLFESEAVFSPPYLRRLAFNRGIVLSHKDSREDLIAYVSLASYARVELDKLLDEAAPAERQMPSTTYEFNGTYVSADIVAAARKVRVDRSAKHDEAVQVVNKNGAVIVTVEYTQLDPSRTRLQQKRAKEVVIELRHVDGKLQVRATPNAKAEAYVAAMIAQLTPAGSEPPEPRAIDLSGSNDPKVRTDFFLGILARSSADRTSEVTDVRVNRFEDRADEDEESDDDDDEAPNKHPKVAKKLTAELRNASLEGSNILTTKIYIDLMAQGYFISRITWLRKHKDGAEASLEAWFHDPVDSRGFRYHVRSVKDPHSPGDNPPHRKPDVGERNALLGVVEEAARAAYDEVSSKLESGR